MNQSRILCTLSFATALHGAAHAGVVQYTNKVVWLDAAGESTYIGFTEYAVGTTVTSQYASLGATFTDGDDSIFPGWASFPTDGMGLIGSFGDFGLDRPITVQFDTPRLAVAVDFPSAVWMKLYAGSQLVGQTGTFVKGFTGSFAGVTSSVAFDRVVFDNDATIGIDSLYFGPAVPAPSAVGILVALVGSRRSRRCR